MPHQRSTPRTAQLQPWPRMVVWLLAIASTMTLAAKSSECGPLYSPRAYLAQTPDFVAVADLDADGHLDFVVANGGSGASGGFASAVIGYGDGTGEFTPPGFFPVPFTNTSLFLDGRPNHAAVADLNLDGRPDLAFAIGSGEVEIFLGSGGRAFGFSGRVFTRFGTNSVAVGDLNLDGRPDLVVANYGDGSVQVLIGNGTGAFAPLPPRAVGAGADKAVIADFNADALPDVAVSSDLANSVTVLLGNGAGGFLSSTSLPTSGGPNWVAMGDFNEDGKVDLVTAAYDGVVTNAISELLGNGDGTFQAHHEVYSSAVGGAFGLAVADLNGDGHSDVVFTTDGSGTAVVLLGDGVGHFGSPTAFGTGRQPLSVVVGDVNGDGNGDLVVANAISGTVTLSFGNGDGTFGARMFTTGSRPQTVAIGDFNGDGRPDLATADLGSNSITTLLGGPEGTYQPGSTPATELAPTSVATGDFNRDGLSDLAVANDSSNTVSVFMSNGDGTFAPRDNIRTGNYPVSVAAGDFNGDGKPDLAVANSGDVNVSVFLGKGDGTFKGKSNYGTDPSPRFVTAGDVDADGNLDLVVANYDGHTVSILIGTGNGGFKSRKNYSTDLPFFQLSPRCVAIGDWSGDGRPDLAVLSDLPPTAGTAWVQLFQQNADGTFGTPTTYGGGVGGSVALADLNGDGLVDLAEASESSCSVSVSLNAGGYFVNGTQPAFGTGNSPRGMAVGDLNGDGRLDLAVANTRTPGVSVLLNRGTGSSMLATRARAEAKAAPSLGRASMSPNPLNPQGKLSFETRTPGAVTVRIFDVQGHLVRTLLDRTVLAAGPHTLTVDGRRQDGARLASGLYLYRVDTEQGMIQGRFTILK